jgi:BirA family transcriptional regulator, biotin operon repressor / biotin---[acetyl-CoA-carboxylase] ligase
MLCVPEINCNKILVLPTTTSTNTIAMQILQDSPNCHGQIIQAMHQSAGRGQMQASWHNEPEKDLLCSIILQHNGSTADDMYILNMAISLAIRDEINKYYTDVSIKWSNDIMVGNKKIAGILIENTWRGNAWYGSIIGIGLNVFSHSKSFENYDSISLKDCNVSNIRIDLILKNIIININSYLIFAKKAPESVINLYNKKLYKVHQSSTFKWNEATLEAEIMGVNALGQLELRHNGVVNKYNYGSIKQIIK